MTVQGGVAGGHRRESGGHKVVLAVSSEYRESTASWSALLRDLKARGTNEPRLVVGDGNLGLWSALRNIFPLCHGPATLDSLLFARRPIWQGQRRSR